MKKICKNCYFGNHCNGGEACEEFHPLGSDYITDEEIETMIEYGRIEFEDAWRSYIDEFYN